MSDWPSLPRRLLLRFAGAGLAAAPLPVLAAIPEGVTTPSGGKPATTPKPWINFFQVQRLWAYADRQSLRPGDPLTVFASVGPGQPKRRVRLEVFRLAATGLTPIWTSDFVDVGSYGATASAASIGPGWPPAFAAIDTHAWPPGCYSADLVEQTTATRDVRAVQWIVTNPKRSGAVLARLGTNTYQAYNEWGGHSLYPDASGADDSRGLMVSFDRPAPPDFFEYDAYLVQWLEALAPGLGGVDYAGNFDVHADPTLIEPYRLVITGSHDEYWSGEEFSAFERRIFTLGRNTAFLGGNTAYRQVRYGDLNAAPGQPSLGRQIVCYKTAFDPVQLRPGKLDPALLITREFRADARRPETMLLGGAYQSWFEPATDQRPDYHVVRADLPFFEGVGWKAGDTAAPVVGYEWDNRDPDGDGQRLWKVGVSKIAAIDPARIQVLFTGTAIDVDGNKGVAEATYFQSPAGAKVFNAGSIRWVWGLSKDGFTNAPFRKFNENLVRMLSA